MKKSNRRITKKYLFYSGFVNGVGLLIIASTKKFDFISLGILIVVNFVFDLCWEYHENKRDLIGKLPDNDKDEH